MKPAHRRFRSVNRIIELTVHYDRSDVYIHFL